MRETTVKQWILRPEQIDCHICGGASNSEEGYEDEDIFIDAGECCAGTGLDEMPWTETHTQGRERWNGK